MADGVKISSLPSATTPSDNDVIAGVQNGTTKKFSFSLIKSWLLSLFVPASRKVNNKALTVDITLDASDVGAVDADDVGVADGVASLDSTGKVPSSQLPSISSDAEDITYDPTTSGLTATNVQDAIDEVVDDLGDKQPSITASGILLGDGQGGVTAATAGTDYQAPLTAGTDYATPAQLADKANLGQIGYPETGTTASRNYSAGEYICWNGLTYTANQAISSGTTLSADTGGNLTECAGGGLNAVVKSTTKRIATETWGTVDEIRSGNIVVFSFRGNANTPPSNVRNQFLDYTVDITALARGVGIGTPGGANNLFMLVPNNTNLLRMYFSSGYQAWTDCSVTVICE